MQINAAKPKLITYKETPLLLYCQSGMRSGHACTLIKQLGYTQVSNGGGIGGLALKLDRPIRRLI
jgi:phage shock protein E